MKHTFTHQFTRLSGLIAAGLLSSATLAADPAPPATVPAATAPSVAQPNAIAPAARVAPRVEVFAFTPVNKDVPADWIGRGIQENLQSDIARTGATLVLPPHQATATEDPIDAARRDHADLAVVGTYQIVGDQVRVNAHVLDVVTNTPVGGFSATGTQRDLFQVEDALGEQLRRLLPRPVAAAQAAQQPGQQTQPEQTAPTVTYAQPAPSVVYQEAPSTVYAPPTYYQAPADYYPDYGYPYSYYGGYYGYPYGFYGAFGYGGIVYGGGYRGGYYRGGGGFHGSVGVHSGGGVHIGGGGVHFGGGGGGFHGGGGHR